MRLIDKDKLIEALDIADICEDCKHCERGVCCSFTFDAVTACYAICESPEIEIVHCKDCKWFATHGKRCKVWNHGVDENDFCSRGER